MHIAGIMAYASAGLLALSLVPRAGADEWNQKTIMTFSGPVEIPGQVLPAGTYVFKLADSQADRNVVEVFNKDESHMYGFFLAIPDYRLKPRGKPIITFEERAAGAPEAVKAWFYPGDDTDTSSSIRRPRRWSWRKRISSPLRPCRRNWPRTPPNPRRA